MNYVEPIRSRKDVTAIEEYLKLHNIRNRLIFVFGINTGLIVSDILALVVDDVLNKTHIEIREKKTGKYKRFPINKKLKKLLDDYLVNKEIGEPLFVGKKNKRLHCLQVYRFLNDGSTALNIKENIGTHTMRNFRLNCIQIVNIAFSVPTFFILTAALKTFSG